MRSGADDHSNAAMAILMAGLLALFVALDGQDGTARWAGRFGAGGSSRSGAGGRAR